MEKGIKIFKRFCYKHFIFGVRTNPLYNDYYCPLCYKEMKEKVKKELHQLTT